MKLKKIKPQYGTGYYFLKECRKAIRRDNPVRAYSETNPLEDVLRAAIIRERDLWRAPYWVHEDENGCRKKDCEPLPTIRERLAMDDAPFRRSDWHYGFSQWCTKIRVPSLKRSDSEWENFYRTFPHIAVYVALGSERFCDGAKLKYIPLFKKILDENWPEDLPRWTETQYQDLIERGHITR